MAVAPVGRLALPGAVVDRPAAAAPLHRARASSLRDLEAALAGEGHVHVLILKRPLLSYLTHSLTISVDNKHSTVYVICLPFPFFEI